MSAPTQFPLAWPTGRPRTKSRKTGGFKTVDTGGRWRETRDLTVAKAVDRLEAEVGRIGGQYPLLSTNLQVGMRGGFLSGQRNPDDPGACLYFTLKGKPLALACDTYLQVAHNIAAIAAHLEAVRKIERHGVATAAETLQAFEALPAPKHWSEILGVPADATPEDINRAFRGRARGAHPDQGGTHAAMAELTAARDAALRTSPPRPTVEGMGG